MEISLSSEGLWWAVCINHTVSSLIYKYSCKNSLVEYFGSWNITLLLTRLSCPLPVLKQNWCQKQLLFSDVNNNLNYPQTSNTVLKICCGNQQILRFLLRHIYVFQYLPQQKNAEAIKLLGIFKITFLRTKYFCWKKNVLLNKKVIFVFYTIWFWTWFHNADHLLYSLFILFFVLLYKFLGNRT